MDDEQKEFLTLLGYFYLQNKKAEKALILFRALYELFPEDINVIKSLSYAYLINGENEIALSLIEKYMQESHLDEEIQVGYLLKSKSLWNMGRRREARSIISDFLGMKGISNEAEL